MNETIDVVVITYCSAQYVIETLDSIYNQTYRNIRLIISDDCSKDNTIILCKQWIEEHKQQQRFVEILLLTSEKNKGTVYNCQRAFEYIEAKYYMMIAGDDYVAPEFIERCLEKHSEMPDAGFVFTSSNLVYENTGKIEKEDISRFQEGNIFEDLLLLNFWPKSGSFVFRTEAMREVGGYNTDIWVEDYDYALRLSNKYQIGWVHEYLMYYRLHNNNSGKDSIKLINALIGTLNQYSNHPKYKEAKAKLENRLIAVAKKGNPYYILHLTWKEKRAKYLIVFLKTIVRNLISKFNG